MKIHTLLLALLLVPAVHASPAEHDHTGTPSHSLTISGAVKAPGELDLAAIKKLAPKNTGPMNVICASGQLKGKADNYRGVLLTDVLDSVVIDRGARHRRLHRHLLLERAVQHRDRQAGAGGLGKGRQAAGTR